MLKFGLQMQPITLHAALFYKKFSSIFCDNFTNDGVCTTVAVNFSNTCIILTTSIFYHNNFKIT